MDTINKFGLILFIIGINGIVANADYYFWKVVSTILSLIGIMIFLHHSTKEGKK